MSSTPAAAPVVPGRERRVRHRARETVALMAFSAAASVGMATALLLLISLGR